MKLKIKTLLFVLSLIMFFTVKGQTLQESPSREKLSMDFGWRFALGHAWDTKKDFDNGSGYFSYFAKTGYGDGAASKEYDDRVWRKLD